LASRRREQELAQRLAAAEAQQAELMAQQKARDAQLLELTRHLRPRRARRSSDKFIHGQSAAWSPA
ncbi:hypothetical protein L7Q78_45935, partial [Achromobacter xylosoxidans]|nr:hypothetical protein [Achromobacter xylosoxidans]